MYQEKVDVAALVDAAPAPGLLVADVERQETDVSCNLRMKWLNCWLLIGTLQDNVSKDATTIETRDQGLDSRWEMVGAERRVQHHCQRCPAARQNSTTGRWSRAAPCCLRAALHAHLNHLKAPLTW